MPTARPPSHALPTAPAGDLRVERGVVVSDGCDISWWATGSGGPPVVLLHGGGAHSGWWHPVVDRLARRRRVIGLDLSGHGDSGRRASYSSALWAEEITAVIDAVAGGRAVVFAHSMGGRPSSVMASRHPDRVAALVLLDTVVPTHDGEVFPIARPARIYPTLEEAAARFRIAPGETSIAPELLRTLALQSITPVSGGFSWKFDPEVFNALEGDPVNAFLPGIRCPLVAVYGSESQVVRPERIAALEAAVGRPVPLLTVPGAHHHVMLDRPQETAALLDWLLVSQALEHPAEAS